MNIQGMNQFQEPIKRPLYNKQESSDLPVDRVDLSKYMNINDAGQPIEGTPFRFKGYPLNLMNINDACQPLDPENYGKE